MSNVQLAMSNDSQPRKMKTTTIPFCEFVPVEWDIIPNRYLFVNHSIKVGENANDYQLLSLTTGGVKKKDINASGGKVPTSYDNYQTVSNGDMIFCLFDLDCSAVFSGLSPFDGMITSAYDVYMPDKKYVDKHYIEYWFQYVFSYRYYKMYSKSIRYTITSDMFKMIVTPVPPIQEQQIIGNFLDRKCTQIDALIANEEQQIAKLKAYKQSVITETVTKGLDPDVPMKDSGVEWIGEIPEHWNTSRLKNLSYIVRGGSPRPAGDERYYIGSIPFMKISDITKDDNIYVYDCINSIKEAGLSHTRMVEKGTLLLTNSGATLGVPKITMFRTTFNDGIAAFLNLDVRINIIFAYYSLKARTKMFLESASMGMGQPNLNTDIIGNTIITLPSIQEQEEIILYLDQKCEQIDRLIAIKKQKIEKIQQYKKSIIYEYVTGKREVST